MFPCGKSYFLGWLPDIFGHIEPGIPEAKPKSCASETGRTDKGDRRRGTPERECRRNRRSPRIVNGIRPWIPTR